MKGLLHLPRVCGGVPFPYCISFLMLNLLRARGDVPHALRIVMTLRLFTPRTRGCPRVFFAPILRSLIYPAPAGMYLIESGMKPKEIHLPRVCGGVPWRMVCPPPAYTFTPRSRGVFPMRLTADHLHADLPRAREDVPE